MTVVSLAPDVRILSAGQGMLHIDQDGRQLALTGTGGLERALTRLAGKPASLTELSDLAQPANGALRRALLMLARRRLIEFRCQDGPRTLMTAVPAGAACSFGLRAGRAPGAKERFRLSRFACARREGPHLIVECPHRSVQVTVREPELGALIFALAEPATAASAAARLPARLAPAVPEALAFLLACGVLDTADSDGRLAEDRDPQLAQREFHDVLLHAHSRSGLAASPIGGVFPFAGVIPAAQAVKPPMSSHPISLPAPDLGQLTRDDPPLAKVMEERRSIRRHGSTPLTIGQLGEFLGRVAGVRETRAAGTDPRHFETTRRPYPSGGATYDLEIYLVARDCAGLPPGFYHYEPGAHALSGLDTDPALTKAMEEYAYFANGQQGEPQVLFVIASRFARVSWKYRGISYATTLRNVGVLYEAMYLAATAMGLAPCALGAGDSAVFSQATSLDPLVESSVGEFMLGTRAS
jgi:SagB-type dehydrogenase family enzyme